MKIIALKGNNGSGKSTVSALIASKLSEKGIDNKVLAFADPLKKILKEIQYYEFGQDYNIEDRTVKNSKRNDLEQYANIIKESFSKNPFIWEIVDQLCSFNINSHLSPDEVAIISDLRFEDEYRTLKRFAHDGDELIIIEIQNTLTPGSEYELDKINSDYVIQFNSNLEEQIDNILKEIL